MQIISAILVSLVGLEHLLIMGLEMFASPQKQADLFELSINYTQQPEAKVAMANQGIYNGMLGLLILVSYWLLPVSYHLVVTALLLLFVIVVALYGGFTVSKKVWLMQMLPAILALVAVGCNCL
jgi:putative membrane protein